MGKKKDLSEVLSLEEGTVVVCRASRWEGEEQIPDVTAYKYVGVLDGEPAWMLFQDEEFYSLKNTREIRDSIISIFRPNDTAGEGEPGEDIASALDLRDGTVVVLYEADAFPCAYTYYGERGWLSEGAEDFVPLPDTAETRSRILSIFRPNDGWIDG